MIDTTLAKNFIEKIWQPSYDEFKRSGIHPYVSVTQSAHESGWGRSGLTVKANNLFGFTGESWAAVGKPTILLNTNEFVKRKWIVVQRPFRAYKSWADSLADWGDLMQKPTYVVALPFAKSGDVEGFAQAVAAAGYATDPEYAVKLTNIFNGCKHLLPPKDDIK